MKATSVLCACLVLAGCAGLFGHESRQGVSSSLVEYLYPDGEEPPQPPDVAPNLRLPLAVRIAFVPSSSGRAALTEAERVELESDLRATPQKGFGQAMADMTVNLDKELDVFKDRIRQDQSVRVTYSPGYSGGGGGAAGVAALAGIAMLLGICRRRRP